MCSVWLIRNMLVASWLSLVKCLDPQCSRALLGPWKKTLHAISHIGAKHSTRCGGSLLVVVAFYPLWWQSTRCGGSLLVVVAVYLSKHFD